VAPPGNLLGALKGRFEVAASVPLVIEYEAVLTRPEHLEASGLTSQKVNEVLDAFVKVSIPVHLRFLWRPRLKDPADEMVLETAVNGSADWLITFDLRHLAEAARGVWDPRGSAMRRLEGDSRI
jgi:predicted nucleic acid-binding protein